MKNHKTFYKALIPILLLFICGNRPMTNGIHVSTRVYDHTPTTQPVCTPGSTVKGTADETLPGYLDILSVTSQLEGIKLTVTFHLREIPDEITINSSDIPEGKSEIAWGVDIDKDNNPDTGSGNFVLDSGYGFDSTLQAYNLKQGAERTDTIQDLFRYLTRVWDEKKEDRSIRSGAVGKIEVDQDEKTLTLSASIPNIKPDSHLHFYTFYNGETKSIDELCRR